MATQKAISDFFARDLGAPLQNIVWSWGAVTPDYKRQALRVWAHDVKKIEGKWWVSVDYVQIPEGKTSLGAPERQEHVRALRQGRPTIGVVVTAAAKDEFTKEISYYDDSRVMLLGNEFLEIGNDVYARVVKYIEPKDFQTL